MKFVNSYRVIFLVLALVFLTNDFSAQEVKLPEGIQKITSLGGINEYRLSNGLQILIFPDRSKPNTTVNIVYKVGSRHEGYGETGMAHLLEHLLFKGTPKYPNIMAELTRRVSSTNATTYLDRTMYFESFPTNDSTLEFALDLEADRMINSFVAKKDLDSEFSVVRNEMERNDNSPLTALRLKMTAMAYEWHNYGNSVIGARSDVENVKIENLQAFYRKYYQPDNAVLIVAGNLDEQKTLDLIKQKFGAIPGPKRELPKFWTIEPAQEGERKVVVRRTGQTQILMAGYHVAPTAHQDAAGLLVAQNILADSPSGRLYKTLVESKKATNVMQMPMISSRDPGYVIFLANLGKSASLETARETLIETIEQFANTPPTVEEVERAKANALKTLELGFNDPGKLALDLSEWIAAGDWKMIFVRREQLKKITPADVQKVAQKYFIQNNRTIGEFIPAENSLRAQTPLITDSEIAALTKDLKIEATVAEGEFFDASPKNIEARLKRASIGGLKTGFLTKKNRGETVNAVLHLHFGDDDSLRNRGFVGFMTARMLLRGSKKYTRQQIQDELSRLNSTINVSGDNAYGRFFITSTRQALPDVLRLLGEVLKNPAFTPTEFEQLRQEFITAMQRQIGEPSSVAQREMERLITPYSKGEVNYTATLEETIGYLTAMKLDDIKAYYRDFYGASNGELAIVGDFDETATAELTNELFANWKSAKPFKEVSSKFFALPAFDKSIETPGKANAYFLARVNLKLSETDDDYPAFVLANYMLGGGSLDSRLVNRIRQKEGISYTVRSEFWADPRQQNAYLAANAIYAPQNLGRLEKAFQEEMQKVATDGFTEAEVNQAKQGWLLGRQRTRGRDLDLTAALQRNLFNNRTFVWEDELDKKVLALTAQQINAVMKKHLSGAKFSVVKAGDFAPTAQKD